MKTTSNHDRITIEKALYSRPATTAAVSTIAAYDVVAEAIKTARIAEIEAEMTEAKQIKLAFHHTTTQHQNAIDTIIRLGRELRELEVA